MGRKKTLSADPRSLYQTQSVPRKAAEPPTESVEPSVDAQAVTPPAPSTPPVTQSPPRETTTPWTAQKGSTRREKERTRRVSGNAGRVVGPGGCIVRAIEAQFGVQVTVEPTELCVRGCDNGQLDRAAAAIDNIVDSDGAEAMQLLSNHLRKNTGSLRPAPIHESIHVHNVPSDMVPHLIGKGGGRIRRIIEDGLALITNQLRARARTLPGVIGPASQCRLAAQRLTLIYNSDTRSIVNTNLIEATDVAALTSDGSLLAFVGSVALRARSVARGVARAPHLLEDGACDGAVDDRGDEGETHHERDVTADREE